MSKTAIQDESAVQDLPALGLSRADVLADYSIACLSREASLLGRKEVFMGKAKFGIFGDGKELPQLAMARVFANGDFRSGYYRDQTFMLARGMTTLPQYFAQLYAHTSITHEPASGGRLMNGHFATRLLNDQGHWIDQTAVPNSSSDISPTGGQMPRLLGLAYASKLFRHNEAIPQAGFSKGGNEIAFGTIGNASTSEGLFFETMNAAAVLQVPMFVSVWDDHYGISVSQEYHTAKLSISAALAGMQRTEELPGLEIITVNGWDYPALLEAYRHAADLCRREHVPVLMHVIELTQPQGHSTSGSHERYKSKERLAWEAERDGLVRMREWIHSEGLASDAELKTIEEDARKEAQAARSAAWQAYRADIDQDQKALVEAAAADGEQINLEANTGRAEPLRAARRLLAKQKAATLRDATRGVTEHLRQKFNTNLLSGPEERTLGRSVAPEYASETASVDGREILLANFDHILASRPEVFIIGEDVGRIGDVNQGLAGLQAKHGQFRVTDTGIREATIVGQGIGAALRGLRPIVEIQYLDYLLYALQILSDDLACLSYRTAGGQKAPLIVRTRGHRLEGMWHSGSPMGMIIHALRGMHVIVPRSMAQAAAFYNTCLELDDPSLIVEPLNGYRIKEALPTNLSATRLPLGVPETIREGTDITIVTYGAMCRIVLDAAEFLDRELAISCEVIDARTLLPFDLEGLCTKSLAKTSRLLVADEDVPGGASAYILQQILQVQDGYHLLDSAPITLTAQAHRPAYGTDGDYFSKPNAEDIIEAVYALIAEAEPRRVL